MTVGKVMDMLNRNRNERGIEAWKKVRFDDLDSFGIGLTQLKQLAKKIPNDHDLALKLWDMKNYDARVMAVLIDDPGRVTLEQVHWQIEKCSYWLMSHIYCSNLLNKTPYAVDLSAEWIESKDAIYRRCSYLLVSEIAKNDKKLHNSFFEDFLSRIEKTLRKEENFVKDAMNHAMYMIGRRNLELNARAVFVARKIGSIRVDYGDDSCQPLNVLEHLTDIRLQLRLKAKSSP